PSELQLCSDPGEAAMPERRDELPGRPGGAEWPAERPENFAGGPGDGMDAFSEILSGVKLNGALFFTAEFSAPWGFLAPSSTTMAAMLAPGAAHVLIYHFVIEGGALVQLPDGPSIELEPGDVVIFPHGDSHEMSRGGALAPFPNYGIGAKIKARDLSPLRA